MADIKAISMPKWGLEMTEGTLAKWHVSEGEKIKKGQVIMDVETDKIANEVEADVEGVLKRHVAEEGQTLKVGELLAVVAPEGADDGEIEDFVKSFKSSAVRRVEAKEDEEPPAKKAEAESKAEPEAAPEPQAEGGGDDGGATTMEDLPDVAPRRKTGSVKASPRAKKLAEKLGIDIAKVEATGARVSEKDIRAFQEEMGIHEPKPSSPRARKKAKELGIDIKQVPGTGKRVTEADVIAYHESGAAEKAAAPARAKAEPGYVNDDVRATPAVRKLAMELGVDLRHVKPSGKGGRTTKDDVEAAAKQLAAPKAKAAPGENAVTVEKLSSMRKAVARRMTESKQNVPHFYLTVDVEIDRLLERRKKVNAKSDVKVSVNDLVIRAAALALKEVPECNVQFHDDELHYFQHADISVAVALEGGLITPIIRAADTKSVQEIAVEMKDLAERARAGKLKMEEIEGGTFSVSNLGMFGIKNFDAVINPPQGAIIAVGKGEERVLAKNGQPTVATVMSVTMSIDHRSIDGALGAQFLDVLKDMLEEPMVLTI